MTWHCSFNQLRKMFEVAPLQLEGVYGSDDLLSGESYFTIMHGTAEVGRMEVEIKVDDGTDPLEPKSLNLMVVVFAAEVTTANMEATIHWGSYQEPAKGNQSGLIRFPPVKTFQIYDSSGSINQDLDCYLVMADIDAMKLD